MSDFQIYSDEGVENVDHNHMRVGAVKKVTTAVMGGGGENMRVGKQPLQEQHPLGPRTVLGCLTDVTNVTRVQPQRAAKVAKLQVLGNENTGHYSKKISAGVKQDATAHASQIPFTIFEDTSTARHLSDRLDENVGKEHATVALSSNNQLPTESPMVVDFAPSSGSSSDDAGTSENKKLAEESVNKVNFIPEYRKEIYQNIREIELRYQPRPDYMRRQQDISYSMRSILVDWLVEVADEYRLNRETLCLAVNYVDRFLSVMAVVRSKLQLVGAAAIFIAAKYEEVYPPDVGEFVYITDDTYTKKQVLQMEKIILRALSFDVAAPTASWFCQDVLNEINAAKEVSCLAMYLLELTMMDGEHFMKYLPSVIGTSCVCLANYTLGITGCMKTILEATGYDSYDLKHCAIDLFYAYHAAATNAQQAIREKYKQPKMECVSRIQPPTLPPLVFE